MTATAELRRARLILRPLQLADVDRIQLLFPHWEIVRHMASVIPWPYPPDGALTYIRDVALPAMARGDECLLKACASSTNLACQGNASMSRHHNVR